VYFIVERIKSPNNNSDTYYRVSVARKDSKKIFFIYLLFTYVFIYLLFCLDVPAFDPQLPDPPFFPAGEYFRNWLLIKSNFCLFVNYLVVCLFF
jgi:hypothetical protein